MMHFLRVFYSSSHLFGPMLRTYPDDYLLGFLVHPHTLTSPGHTLGTPLWHGHGLPARPNRNHMCTCPRAPHL